MSASSNAQSCVLNVLQFLDVSVNMIRLHYGACTSQNGAIDGSECKGD